MFNLIEDNNDLTSLWFDGTVSFNNERIYSNVDSYLECVPSNILKEWGQIKSNLDIDDSVLKYIIDDIIKFDKQGLSHQEIHDLLREREIFANTSNTAIAYLIIDTLTD